MTPLVSILIPMYNHSRYICECLESVSDMKYKNIELIICDDGSSDDSYIVAQKWLAINKVHNAKLLQQLNKGICKTLNRLISESSGEFIIICASDDLLLPDAIDERLELFKGNNNIDAIIGDALLIDGNSKIISSSAIKSLYHASYEKLILNIKKELVLNWCVVGPSLMVRKNIYNKIGFYDESLKIEDRDFYLRCLANDSISFHPKLVAKYRLHDSNSSRGNERKFNIWKQVAISNIKNASRFSGVMYLFLISHKMDLMILSGNFGYLKTISFYIWKAIRRSLSYVSSIFI
ncbi:glycosyltransferase [Aeromonas veronii]